MRIQSRTSGRVIFGAVATLSAASLILVGSPNSAGATTEAPDEDAIKTSDGRLVLPDPDATVFDLDNPAAAIDITEVPRGLADTPGLSAQSVPGVEDEIEVRRIRPRLSPSTSRKLGVAQVVTMKFPVAINRKARVEKAITVVGHKNGRRQSAVKLPRGRWRWMDSRTAVYRPKRFWPGRTTMRFEVNLRGVTVARRGTVRYQGGSRSNFTYKLRTARSLILKIRNRTHRMYVIRDGKQVRSFGVSLGKRGYETRSGIKVLTGIKYRNLRMRGTDRFTGERWDVISPYSIPVTTFGEFIHGAPWARYRIGYANGSHGCTNMNTEDARWIFKRVRAGDPVVTRGTGHKMQPWMSFTPGKPWVYSWRQWKSG